MLRKKKTSCFSKLTLFTVLICSVKHVLDAIMTQQSAHFAQEYTPTSLKRPEVPYVAYTIIHTHHTLEIIIIIWWWDNHLLLALLYYILNKKKKSINKITADLKSVLFIYIYTWIVITINFTVKQKKVVFLW